MTTETRNRAIYLAWKSGKYTQDQLAEKYGVSVFTIHRVISMKLANRKVA